VSRFVNSETGKLLTTIFLWCGCLYK